MPRPKYGHTGAGRAARTNGGGYIAGAPELAVGVVSPSNRPAGIARKASQYLAAGATAVRVLHPDTREAHVYRPGEPVFKLTENMTLPGPSLFPAWSIRAGQFA